MKPLVPAIVLSFCFASLATPQNAGRTVLDGVYTAEQANRGEAAYNMNCAPCHRETLEGNAEALSLKGERFVESWRDDRLSSLLTHMRMRMPRRPVGEPGSLKESTYVEILSYLLKANGYPAGSADLTLDSAASIQMVARQGPQRVPTNATVRVIGCFVAGPRNTWVLSSAAEPIRTRNAQDTSPEELKDSAGLPLGSNTFALRNLDDFRTGFMPESMKGHRVQVKGVITWQAGNDRLYVISLESVAEQCAR